MRPHPYGRAYRPLLALSGLFAIGAALTLVPSPGASWPNILGYRSLCTFAPGATLACALSAGLACTLRARLVRKGRGPAFAPVLVLGALTLALVASTVAWAGVKAGYAEAVSGASTEP